MIRCSIPSLPANPKFRCACVSVALLLLLPSLASTESKVPSRLPAGLSVVLDNASYDRVGTLDPGGTLIFYVVTDSFPTYEAPYPGETMRAYQFGVEIDPRLEVLERRTVGPLAADFHPTPDDWVVGFLDCQSLEDSPLTLAVYTVQLPVGTPDTQDLRVGLRPLLSGDGMEWIGCQDVEAFWRFIDAGGLVLNPSAPSIVRFGGAPSVLVERRDFHLSWETALADEVLLNGLPVEPTALVMQSPTTDTTYELTALAGGASESATFDVELIREPRVDWFTAEAATDDQGNPTVGLSWSVRGADTVEVSGVGVVESYSAVIVDFVDPPVFVLAATNEWGTTSETVSLEPPPDAPPIIYSFDVSPQHYDASQPVVLHWLIVGADTVVIDPDVGFVDPTAGTLEVWPDHTTTYTLTATNAHGSSTASGTTQQLPVQILEFTASPSHVYAEHATTLIWNTRSARELRIDPDVGPLPESAGSVQVTPTSPETHYVLTASNGDGEVSQTQIVYWKVPGGSLHASERNPFPNETITLIANVYGADSATLEPGIGSIPPTGGSFELTVETPTLFVLSATNAAGTMTRELTVTPKAPVVGLTVSNSSPNGGEPFQLTATIEGADSATLEPGFGNIDPAGGVFTSSVTEATTFTLSAINAAGTSTAQLNVVPQGPEIEYFTANPQQLGPGETSTLSWSVLHADLIQIEPLGLETTEGSGSVVVDPPVSTVYTLTASNVSGAHTATVLVGRPAPVVLSFVADPEEVGPGQSTTLIWSVRWAETITIEPLGLETTDLQGMVELTPTETTTYVLTATNPVQGVTAEATVQRIPFSIVSFSADPTTIDPGGSSTLSWEVAGTASVNLDPIGPVPMMGSMVVEPVESTQYTLLATDGNLERSSSLWVSVYTGVLAGTIVPSWSPTEYPGVRPDITPSVPWTFYVLAFDPPGCIYGYEFGVYLPWQPSDGFIIGVEYANDTSTNFGSATNIIVGTGVPVCGAVIRLLRTAVITFVPELTGQIVIGPASPSSFSPPSPGYVPPSDPTDIRPFVVGPGLDLEASTEVSSIVLGLSAGPADEGVMLRWDVPVAIDELTLWRALGSQLPVELRSWRGREVPSSGEWLDRSAEPGVEYRYWAAAWIGGEGVASIQIDAMRPASQELADRTRLLANVPNPFNPHTEIRFELDRPAAALLEIFDVAGRRVRSQRLSTLPAGVHGWSWDGRDDRGTEVRSGMYLVRLIANGQDDATRITLIR